MWPSPTLQSRQVRDALMSHFVRPALQAGFKVSAFRLSWFGQSTEHLSIVWDQVVPLRDQLDQKMKEIGGVIYFVSAITATTSGKKKDAPTQKRLVFPGVAYWLVSLANFSERDLFNHMQNNGLGATMKLLLQPFQQTEKDLANGLFQVLKDNMEGCVRKMINCGNQGVPPGSCQIAKVFQCREDLSGLSLARDTLTGLRFNVELVHY